MQDKVSIITPSWNSEKYIKKTIESVQNQTYLNWEMIIVDDCSSDNTVKIVQEISKAVKNIEKNRDYIQRNNYAKQLLSMGFGKKEFVNKWISVYGL